MIGAPDQELIYDFRRDAQLTASVLFERLDPDLDPIVLLYEVVTSDDRSDISFHSDADGFPVGCFKCDGAIVSELRTLLRRSQNGRWPLVEEDQPRFRAAASFLQNCIGNEIQQIAEQLEFQVFISSAIGTCGTLLGVVLLLDRLAVERNFKYRVESQEYSDSSPDSLLAGVIEQFFREALTFLDREIATNTSFVPDPSPLIQRAAEKLLRSIAPTHGGHLFSICESLCTVRYESAECRARIVLSRQNDDRVHWIARFKRPADLENVREGRKLLATCTESTCVHSTGTFAHGICSVAITDGDKRAPLSFVRFYELGKWALLNGDQEVLRVAHGKVMLPAPDLNQELLERAIKARLGAYSPDVTQLVHLAEMLQQQLAHGGMIVFSHEAAEEAKRLSKTAFEIEPKAIDGEHLASFGQIDGAVLVDPSGVCHAIGVVLDGPSCDDEDRARGSRFNSAVRYTHAHPGTLAIVKSEDGMLDVIPSMGHPCRRVVLDRILKRLQCFVNAQSFRIRDFYSLRDDLWNFRWHGTAADREIVDTALTEIETKTTDVRDRETIQKARTQLLNVWDVPSNA